MAVKKETTPDVNSTDQRTSEFLERMRIAKAPAWMPEPGEVLIGEVIGLSMRQSDFQPYPCVTYTRFADDGSVVNLHAFHTLVRERLAELKTDIGSRHIVTYLGKRKKTTPNKEGEFEEYHDYYVEDFTMDSTTTGPAKSADFTF